jgi:hypothetical protein
MVALLLWPKLFDGWVLASAYRRFGDGDRSGDGQGSGQSTPRRMNGNGDGMSNGDRYGGGHGYDRAVEGMGDGYGTGNGGSE